MIGELLHSRVFTVSDGGSCSQPRPQHPGISQGCTLSPLLLVMVMTVLLHDGVASVDNSVRAAYECDDLDDADLRMTPYFSASATST